MRRPIPRKLLIHEVSYSKFLSEDSWGGKVYQTAVTLSYVKFELIKKTLLNSLGENQNDRAVLFYDIQNSTPRVDISKKDKISFRGNDYEVRDIDYLEGTAGVHHLEIMLV